MPVLRIAALAASFMLLAQAALAADKYVWNGTADGNGKCSSYSFHLELVVDNGHATGWWLQKGRTTRNFDFVVKPDGTFGGDVDISNGNTVTAKGQLGANPKIDLTGYCNFGGPLKKE